MPDMAKVRMPAVRPPGGSPRIHHPRSSPKQQANSKRQPKPRNQYLEIYRTHGIKKADDRGRMLGAVYPFVCLEQSREIRAQHELALETACLKAAVRAVGNSLYPAARRRADLLRWDRRGTHALDKTGWMCRGSERPQPKSIFEAFCDRYHRNLRIAHYSYA
jgi:hypothetical protein